MISMNRGFPRPFFMSVIALFFSLTVASQEKTFFVSGKVIDEKTSQVLAGASVFCQNTTIGTVSKSDGSFSLKLPNGRYDMVVSYTVHETNVIRIRKRAKENAALTVEL